MADPATLMATWLTPSSLFILVNLVIGTIALSSRFGAPKRKAHEPQLVRSPSLLDRVRSFNLGHYNHNEPTFVAESESTHPQLVQTPSLLERVRSFNFSFNKYEPTRPETEDETELAQPHEPEPENPQLVRTPSLLQRLRPMTFSRREEQEPESEGPDSKPGRDSGIGEKREMRKSASEKPGSVKEEDEGAVERRRPETARAETTSVRGDEEVDAKADDFINRFKKQLRLQRIDSIIRYRDTLREN